MIDLRLLGGIDVRVNRPDGTEAVLTQPKRLALLLYLALAEPAGLQTRDRLLALLWPEADEASARHSLRNALHALRQALGGHAIVTRGEAFLGLDFGEVWCDAVELRAHLAAGRVDEAVRVWTGDLAPGFHVSGAPDFDDWLDGQRVELRRAVQAAAWSRAHRLEGAGLAEVDALRRALRLDPGDEPGTRRLMRLLSDGGDRGGALRAYQDLADWFARELETEPSDETRALAGAIRAAPAMTRPAAVPAPGSPPPPVMVPSDVKRTDGTRRLMAGMIMAGLVAPIALGIASYLSSHSASQPTSRASAENDSVSEAERAVLRLPRRYRADTAAYSSYLRGLTLRFQFRFTESRDTFASLVDREPLYVPGLYGLAHALIFVALNDLTDPDEAWPKIHALALRALALDSTSASAWLALASEDMFRNHDLARARERIDRAGTLDPLDPDAPGMMSAWLRFCGQMDSAVAEAQRAHRLDPLSVSFARLVGKQLYFARRYDESRRVFEGLLRDDPGWRRGYSDLADLYSAMGRPRDAVEWLRRARAAEGDSAGAAALPTVSTDSAALRLLRGDARRRIALLDSTTRVGERVPPWRYASAFATLGDTLATLCWLDSMLAHDDDYLAQIRVDPAFDFLRGDPRYRSWESRSGLPPLASGRAPGKLAPPSRYSGQAGSRPPREQGPGGGLHPGDRAGGAVLESTEEMAGVDILRSDKTGTLTARHRPRAPKRNGPSTSSPSAAIGPRGPARPDGEDRWSFLEVLPHGSELHPPHPGLLHHWSLLTDWAKPGVHHHLEHCSPRHRGSLRRL